jgi:hypothetical protein
MNMKALRSSCVAAVLFFLCVLQSFASSIPQNSPAYSHLGQPLTPRAVESTISSIKREIAAEPNSYKLWLSLGDAYMSLSDLPGHEEAGSEATSAFEKAIEVGVKQGRIVGTYQLSEALVSQGNRAALDQVFQSLMKLPAPRPDRYIARLDYARALEEFGDDRAENYYRQAIDVGGFDYDIGAYSSYAAWLIKKQRGREAFYLLNELPETVRVRYFDPAVLRNQLIDQFALKVDKDNLPTAPLAGIGPAPDSSENLKPVEALRFAHNNTGDDCRLPGSPITCFTYGSRCYYYYVINLAEVLWNEARGETPGARAMVGWTVRDRAYETPTCDSYVGGASSSCHLTMPCSQLGQCDLSQRYCCVLHGGTFTVGASQSQFNDTHVQFSTLGLNGFLAEALNMVNGLIPDPSTSFVTPGVSGCTFGCTSLGCTTGSELLTPSPSGPMEYLNFPYTAAQSQCKTVKGAVCGDGAPDNYFWNRKP